MYVCVCNAITDRQIEAAVADGVSSMAELQRELPVASCCGRCGDCARSCLNQALAQRWADEGFAASMPQTAVLGISAVSA